MYFLINRVDEAILSRSDLFRERGNCQKTMISGQDRQLFGPTAPRSVTPQQAGNLLHWLPKPVME